MTSPSAKLAFKRRVMAYGRLPREPQMPIYVRLCRTACTWRRGGQDPLL